MLVGLEDDAAEIVCSLNQPPVTPGEDKHQQHTLHTTPPPSCSDHPHPYPCSDHPTPIPVVTTPPPPCSDHPTPVVTTPPSPCSDHPHPTPAVTLHAIEVDHSYAQPLRSRARLA